jgi:hypothetical protein
VAGLSVFSDDLKTDRTTVNAYNTLARCVPFRRIAKGPLSCSRSGPFFRPKPLIHRLILRLHTRRDSIAGLPRAQSPTDVAC